MFFQHGKQSTCFFFGGGGLIAGHTALGLFGMILSF
jgi:hypothetical protein